MPYLGESTLGESEVFNRTINSGMEGTTKASDAAIELIKANKFLTQDDCLKSITIAERSNDQLIKDALRYLESGRIKLVYDPDRTQVISKALPFMTVQVGGKYITYIFIDPYVTALGDGTYSFKDTVFKDLLVAGMISNVLKTNYSAIKNNSSLKELMMQLYSQFFIRVLNRLFSVLANRLLVEKIRYCTNRFFLENVFVGSAEKSDAGAALAAKDVKNVPPNEMEELVDAYNAANIHSLSALLEFLSTLSPRLKGLQMRGFMQKWINTYYITQMLSVDTLEYFMFMLMALYYNDAVLVNVRASDILKESKAMGILHASINRLAKGQLNGVTESVLVDIMKGKIDRMLLPGQEASDLDIEGMALHLEYGVYEDSDSNDAGDSDMMRYDGNGSGGYTRGYDPMRLSLNYYDENYRMYRGGND